MNLSISRLLLCVTVLGIVSADLGVQLNLFGIERSCTYAEKLRANQCTMVLTETYLPVSDFTGMRTLPKILESFNEQSLTNGQCARLWQMIMCTRFLGKCFSEMVGGSELISIYNNFGFAYGICSNHTIEESRRIEDCYSTINRAYCIEHYDIISSCK
ncbi:unnamed protein product [Bursaphelenchus okinawaensis]|uniref:DUF19 domain-containing protein n=1 Tax=Bursaphelenchus okinawaensis TaxID=465554 RepID=A0A811JVW6_9BILA|nr:unnamed protein product [Bursaphelenchus okinawaensis]CAG9084823.1 unnamed protein product [Bursaphelenchus okinawaensis]